MKLITKILLTTAGLSAFSFVPAHSDMVVSFDEGAPKDLFTFMNIGDCTIKAANVKLDLSTSTAGLILDVAESGKGVEVFQPLEITSGTSSLLTIPNPKDGDSQLTLEIDELEPGQSISFTIDVDDTLGGREITVSGAEIAGATVNFVQAGKMVSSAFGTNARTRIELEACQLPKV